MPKAPTNSAQKFERERASTRLQPPPPFPRLPDSFINRYRAEPEIVQALHAYSDACQEWVRKNYQGQT